LEERAEGLIDIVGQSRPCTVREVFDQATVRGLVEKSEADYAKVPRQLVDLRREGRIPFTSIADNTRWRRKPITHDSLIDTVRAAEESGRSLLINWADAVTYGERP
jgi:hypothetical protein